MKWDKLLQAVCKPGVCNFQQLCELLFWEKKCRGRHAILQELCYKTNHMYAVKKSRLNKVLLIFILNLSFLVHCRIMST